MRNPISIYIEFVTVIRYLRGYRIHKCRTSVHIESYSDSAIVTIVLFFRLDIHANGNVDWLLGNRTRSTLMLVLFL